MDSNFLTSAVILLFAAIVSVPLSRRLGLGSVLGYLLAGVLIGPFALKLITDQQRILHFAEFGVVMMLFIIGLELSPSKLWRLRREVFGAGSAQVFASTALLALLAWAVGIHFKPALVIAFGLALSSTAAALQILAERRELASPAGRTAISISLFQDIASLPVLAIMPMFALSAIAATESHGWLDTAKALGAIAALVVAGHFLLRPIFALIARQQSTELFTATTLLVVCATALAMQSVGLSMALGAFIAGVMLAESEHRHELEADLEPFKGLLLGLFFIAIGMGMNFSLLLRYPLELLGALLALLLIKGAVLLALGKLLKFERRAQWAFATTLAQGSEFAFVLFAAAFSAKVLSRTEADFLVLLVALSMALTPVLILLKDRLSGRIDSSPNNRAFDQMPDAEPRVIIAGFGRFGQIIARVLLTQKVPFTALEKSQEQVDFVRRFGNRIYYGDASRLELLRAAKADRAELLVLAIDDVESSVATAALARKHFPQLRLMARVRNRNHAFRMMELGVEVVIRDTLHSSLKMSEQVLMSLGLPEALARERVERFRQIDQRALDEQKEFFHDEAKIIASAKNYTRELEELFEKDSTELTRDRF